MRPPSKVPNIESILPSLPGHEKDPYQYAQLPSGDYAFKHKTDGNWTYKEQMSTKEYKKFETELDKRYENIDIEVEPGGSSDIDWDEISDDIQGTTRYKKK